MACWVSNGVELNRKKMEWNLMNLIGCSYLLMIPMVCWIEMN